MDTEKSTPETAAPNYYAVIPASVRYDERLPGKAALLYGEITALSGTEGYCWASSAYFAELYHVKIGTIRAWLRALENAGHIVREELRDEQTNEVRERRLWLVNPPSKNCTPSVEKTTDSPSKNRPQNNINNNIPPIVPQTGDGEKAKKVPIAEQREAWFEYIWQIYPNHNARAPALKRWLRLKPDLDFARRIYRVIQAQAAAGKWSDGFWPELRRWLMDERWNDELTPPGGSSGRVVESEEVIYW